MKKIKTSERRIMLFLSEANKMLKYARMMSIKLDMDYGYMLYILQTMVAKDWLITERSPANPTRKYYQISLFGKKILDKIKDEVIENGNNPSN